MSNRVLAISTGSFHPTPTKQAILRIARLGLKQAEVTVQDADLDYDYHRKIARSYFEELEHLARGSGLRVVSLHSPALSSVQAFSSQARSEIMARTLEIAGLLQADEVVVHPYHIFKSYEETCLFFSDTARKIMDSILPDLPSLLRMAKQHGVKFAIENVAHWHDNPLLNEPRNMLRLVQSLGSDTVGVDLDTYHSELGGSTFEFLDRLGDYIRSIHLSDCDDSRHRTLPGKGRTDWEELARRIGSLANLDHLVMEITGQFEDRELVKSADYLRGVFGLET